MLSTFLMLALGMQSALAKSELVAKSDFHTEAYRIQSEIYFDKDTKRPDLWVDFRQAKTPTTDADAFVATSLRDRLKNVEWRLELAPVSIAEGETTQVFYGFNTKTGDYDGNRSFALLFHVPIDVLADQTLAALQKSFPNSIALDANARPKYIKSMLCRITESQVYPVAAYDLELDLRKAK